MTSAGPAENLLADCLLGRYELLMPVATGGMAVVWAARLKGSRGFTKIVAIKTMRPELSEDTQFEHMLFDEASLASRVRHPYVVEIMDLGDEKGVPYIVMEWIDGEPIHTIMKAASASGGIPLPISVRIISQACAGLHAAHELRDENETLVGLVHRDVSPQNILVTWDGVAKVVDFGVAKAIGRASDETRAGQVKGKVAWLAPEQARGNTVDRRTDVFSLGLLLYVMTTGKHPFRAANQFKMLSDLCDASPFARPSKVVASYPPQLEKVVMQALEKDPEKRFQTASDMLRALDHALPGNVRISTDEEVASFIRPLLGTRFEQRRKQLKEAQRLADDRASGAGSRASFTTEAVGLMLPTGPGTPATISPASGIQAVGRDSSPEGGAGAGMTAYEAAAAARTVAGIVQRLKGNQAPGPEIVITGAPGLPGPVAAPSDTVPEPLAEKAQAPAPAVPVPPPILAAMPLAGESPTAPLPDGAPSPAAPSSDVSKADAESKADASPADQSPADQSPADRSPADASPAEKEPPSPPAEAATRTEVTSLETVSLSRRLVSSSPRNKWILVAGAGLVVAGVAVLLANLGDEPARVGASGSAELPLAEPADAAANREQTSDAATAPPAVPPAVVPSAAAEVPEATAPPEAGTPAETGTREEARTPPKAVVPREAGAPAVTHTPKKPPAPFKPTTI